MRQVALDDIRKTMMFTLARYGANAVERVFVPLESWPALVREAGGEPDDTYDLRLVFVGIGTTVAQPAPVSETLFAFTPRTLRTAARRPLGQVSLNDPPPRTLEERW